MSVSILPKTKTPDGPEFLSVSSSGQRSGTPQLFRPDPGVTLCLFSLSVRPSASRPVKKTHLLYPKDFILLRNMKIL